MSGRKQYDDLPTLQENVYKYLSSNLSVLSTDDPITKLKNLRDGIIIPSEICDRFLYYHQKNNHGDINDSFINIFKHTLKTPLKFVHLRNSTITSKGLETLFRHNLISLSMWYCPNIKVQSCYLLAQYGTNLKSLELCVDVDLLRYHDPHEKSPVDFQLNFPNLRHLVMHGIVMHQRLKFDHLKDLIYLDLTQSILLNFNLESLSLLKKLKTLILHNVWPIANQIDMISQMHTLQNLDISVSSATNGQGTYNLPDQTLERLIEKLQNITHLDISGTNLAGDNNVAQDIPGLLSRTNRPLQFLGLYHTAHWACKRYDIPALKIAGDANENQILIAADYYRDRPGVLTQVLNDLYSLCRKDSCEAIDTALDVVLTAMDRHLKYKHIQISGSATLFYIVKGQEKTKFDTSLKNHIIQTLLNGMEIYLSDNTMLRNGYLTLYEFSIPIDVIFEYERLIKILLKDFSKPEQEGFVQRIAIYLLNTLATCQVDSRQNLFLGDLGIISTMLNLIKNRLARKVFDDVIQVAWSTMWSVTDETAKNCKRFLDDDGIEYFFRCVKCFPDRDELLRNMIGLLNNVAEVKSLRPRLMTTEFVTVFYNLLDSDSFEVSYDAAGVLAHIASDGDEVWKIGTPNRSDVLCRMVETIDKWNLESQRNINYCSFEPILYLVRCFDTLQCQHWAVWALANLTEVYPQQYCRLVEKECGIELLTELLRDIRPYERTKELANMVIERCSSIPSESTNLDG